MSKDKKRNIKADSVVSERENELTIKLVGLLLIVLSLIGIIAFNPPLSFIKWLFAYMFGSAANIVLALILLLGFYMLFSKRTFDFFNKWQWILLTIVFIFILALSSYGPIEYKINNFASEYNNVFVTDHFKIDSEILKTLGGGIIGYLFAAIFSSLFNSQTIAQIFLIIIIVGLLLIILTPPFRKIVSFLKNRRNVKREKKKLKIKGISNKPVSPEPTKEDNEVIIFNKPTKTTVTTVTPDATVEIKTHTYDYSNLGITKNFLDSQSVNKEAPRGNFQKIINTFDDLDPIVKEKQVATPSTVAFDSFSKPLPTPEVKEESSPFLTAGVNPVQEVKTHQSIVSEPLVRQTTESPSRANLSALSYQLPPIYLLKDSPDLGISNKNHEIAKQKAEILTQKIHELNVNATITAYVVGPSVTRFEIVLDPGVRVNTFINLQEDFKLALGASSIRIETPIPGKSAIGLEVPNEYRSIVSLKELISTLPDRKDKLHIPVGKDIGGEPINVAICDMPHCLIAGSTNSGKSVCANIIIVSLLIRYKPSELKFIMIDPKRVELSFYNEVPHLLCPIITDPSKACVALDKLCKFMMKRFDLFADKGVKNISSYNNLAKEKNIEPLPFVVLVVDEFADVMLSKESNLVEERLQKLVQLGRAAGIHLILSTQRPSVNVITGVIKSNIQCRMTFSLASFSDSKTVIDVGGAEKLLNHGDMLLSSPTFQGLKRLQGAFVTDDEIKDIVAECTKQMEPQYDEAFLDLRSDEEKQLDINTRLTGNNKDSENEIDEMYEDIKYFVVSENRASASLLMRKFAIGFGRAARYMDQLQDEGIIGPDMGGNKPREILISIEDLEKTND